MTSFHQVPETHDADILALRERYGDQPSSILDVLSELKETHGHFSEKNISAVARAYRVPESHVAGMASFYSLLATGNQPQQTIRLCDGVACWMNGANDLRLHCEELTREEDSISIVRSSCLGLCDRAPAALVANQQVGPVSLTPESLGDLFQRTASTANLLPAERPFETRYLLRRPTERKRETTTSTAVRPPDYRHITHMMTAGPDEIFSMLERADLRGMGGAGYPTAQKWKQTAAQSAKTKYIVCNADESEPLSIKDRILIDADPHRVLEGMLLAGFAVGAQVGIIYIRGEYEPQAKKLERAIEEALAAGWLGESIGGTEFSFKVHVHRGAGAYICGEETALLESLEGKRGEPRPRPPYPGVVGLHNAPTIVNNVETLAMAASICEYDEDLSQDARTPQGTKLYSLFGMVNQPGLFEAPRGLTLGEAIEQYGGGLTQGSQFSFALIGGAAGSFADQSCWDHHLDYAHDSQTIPTGTGAILIGDQTMSVPAVLRELLHFFEQESCGKCTPCRIGTGQARQLLDRLLSEAGGHDDLQRLESLSGTLQLSLCGLGTSIPSPINTALRYFRHQFADLIQN